MNNLQKIGGVSALIGAMTNLLGLGVFLVFLAPKGYGSEDLNPSQIVLFLRKIRQSCAYGTRSHFWHLASV